MSAKCDPRRLETLPWLPAAPEDFRAQLAAWDLAEVSDPVVLQRLAATALDLGALSRLDTSLEKAGPDWSRDSHPPVKLAVLADSNFELMLPALRASAVRHGITVETHAPDYGQSMQEVLNPGSPLWVWGPEIALLAFDHRLIGLNQPTMDATRAQDILDRAIGHVVDLIEGLHAQNLRNIVLQTLAAPAEPWSGHYDRRIGGSSLAQIERFNSALIELADRYETVVCDMASVAELVGRAGWSDHSYWHRAKLSVAPEFIPLYADHLARVLGAVRGKARKCLVLDLDNTLWGGVIGDDGLEGIQVGQGSPDGEAHLRLQDYAKSLKERGIILAICSKNEDETAREPFRSHPEMLLREEDFAVFVANWTDKASNLSAIAKTLNIGTDALVFLDDNPAERERVRQMLPEVMVPELPHDPAYFVSMLAQSGCFETVALSAEDGKRAEQYRANAERTLELERIGNYGDYLASLEMVCRLGPFDPVGRTRITQLINKTNQFNLTTRRYTEAEVVAFGDDPNCFTLQVRLEDKFGDNGMISVVIFEKTARVWACDTWLMSCRVLGRRVEEAVLAQVAVAAKAAGVETLTGLYRPTKKNKMVSDHFAKLGFSQTASHADGSSEWALDLANYAAPDLPLEMLDLGTARTVAAEGS